MNSIKVYFTVSIESQLSLNLFYCYDDLSKFYHRYISRFPYDFIISCYSVVNIDNWFELPSIRQHRFILEQYITGQYEFIDVKYKSFENCLCDDLDDDGDHEEELVFFTEDEVQK